MTAATRIQASLFMFTPVSFVGMLQKKSSAYGVDVNEKTRIGSSASSCTVVPTPAGQKIRERLSKANEWTETQSDEMPLTDPSPNSICPTVGLECGLRFGPVPRIRPRVRWFKPMRRYLLLICSRITMCTASLKQPTSGNDTQAACITAVELRSRSKSLF